MILSDRLLSKKFNGYRSMPIPHELDDIVRSVLDGYLQAAPDERSAVIGLIKPRPAGILSVYGERAATMAVRTGSATFLRRALAAVALAQTRLEDDRVNYTRLAEINHSAESIGTSPTALVAELKGIFPDAILENFRVFFSPNPQNKSLDAYLIKPSGNGNYFRYF